MLCLCPRELSGLTWRRNFSELKGGTNLANGHNEIKIIDASVTLTTVCCVSTSPPRALSASTIISKYRLLSAQLVVYIVVPLVRCVWEHL